MTEEHALVALNLILLEMKKITSTLDKMYEGKVEEVQINYGVSND